MADQLCDLCGELTPPAAMDTNMEHTCDGCARQYRKANNLSDCCVEPLVRRHRFTINEKLECTGCGAEVEE